MRKYFLIVVLLFLPLITCAAEAVQVELKVDKNEVAVGDSFNVAVIMKNASTGGLNIGNVNIPGIDKFRQQGSSQSTQIQMLNGATTAVTETDITLVAVSEGEYTIGPVAINAGGTPVTSNTIMVKVDKKANNSFFGDNSGAGPAAGNTANSGGGRGGDWIVNALAVVLLTGMAYALYLRKRREGTETNEASEEPDAPAAGLLAGLPDEGDAKFFEKSKVLLLEYVRRKYKIDTEVLTTSEIVEELKRQRIHKRDEIEAALRLCDRGNFAADGSGKEELKEIIKSLN